MRRRSNRTFILLASAMVILFIIGLVLVIALAVTR